MRPALTATLQALTPEKLQGLSPQLRKAARYVVEHPGEIAMRSQRYVAEATKLPAPTFTRLARAIGFDTYDALREVCRRDVMGPARPLAKRARDLVDAPMDPTGDASLFALHAGASVRGINALLAGIDQRALVEVSKLLAKADNVALIGEMSARPIMEYAAYLADVSLQGWSIVGRSGESVPATLARLGQDDIAIVMSLRPYSIRSVELSKHIRAQGTRVIALTDNVLSPIATMADHSFFLSTECPQFFPSHVCATMFFEALVGMIIRERGTKAQQHIAAVERQNHKLNEYWQDETAAN